MLRSAAVSAAALCAVPALALASSASAAPSTTVQATVDKSGPHGEKISLTQGGVPAGQLDLKVCVDSSATAITCSGKGTVLGLQGKVRIRWHCPVGRTCEGHAEGTLKRNGSTLALLHVKATVVKVESTGSTFRIGVEVVGERPLPM